MRCKTWSLNKSSAVCATAGLPDAAMARNSANAAKVLVVRMADLPSHDELQPQHSRPVGGPPRHRRALGILEPFPYPVYDNLTPLVQVPVNSKCPDRFGVFRDRIRPRIDKRCALFQCTSEP